MSKVLRHMSVSHRLNDIHEYYFSKKLNELAQLRSSGVDVINLGIGSPDMNPDKSVVGKLKQVIEEDKRFMYSSYRGLPQFREAVAEWYRSVFKVKLDASNEIIQLMGSKEGINFISQAYLNPGDKVLVPNPGYPTYSSATKLAGGIPLYYNLTEKSGWLPDFDEMEKLALQKPKMLWINYPNMPTVTAATIDMFEQLVKFAVKHELLICHDNPYGLILNEEPLSIFSVDGAKQVALELNSLSKSHHLAGARIGMLIGSSDLLTPVFKVQSNFSSGMFEPLQLAAVQAMSLGEAWYKEINQRYQARRDLIFNILDKIGCTYASNLRGMFVWAKIPEGYQNGEQFSDYILNNYHFFITPGFVFGSNGDKYVRLSLCEDEKKLKEIISRI
jgi:LL-diaminopimelate aminotransferase